MKNKDNLHICAEWSRSYRGRMEPIIRTRFAERGQTPEKAEAYIAQATWDHPVVAMRRIQEVTERGSISTI
jgi:hypothetical protein